MAQSHKGEEGKQPGTEASKTQMQVRWDDSKMSSTYANVCNVASTREEVTLLFGTNQTWQMGKNELTVELNNRIIMSPFAAKRLQLLLSNTLRDYEARFGVMNLEGMEKK